MHQVCADAQIVCVRDGTSDMAGLQHQQDVSLLRMHSTADGLFRPPSSLLQGMPCFLTNPCRPTLAAGNMSAYQAIVGG